MTSTVEGILNMIIMAGHIDENAEGIRTVQARGATVATAGVVETESMIDSIVITVDLDEAGLGVTVANATGIETGTVIGAGDGHETGTAN
jgi:hypothetical protein